MLGGVYAGFNQRSLDLIDCLLLEICRAGYLFDRARGNQLRFIFDGDNKFEFACRLRLIATEKFYQVMVNQIKLRECGTVRAQTRKPFSRDSRKSFFADVPPDGPPALAELFF